MSEEMPPGYRCCRGFNLKAFICWMDMVFADGVAFICNWHDRNITENDGE